MPTITELLNLVITDIFNERDTAKRSAAIAELVTEDIVFVDPDGETRGRADFEQKVTALLQGQPESFRFGDVEAPRAVGDLGVHRWNLGPAGGDVVATGLDVVLAEGGRIKRLWTLLD